MGEHAVNAPLHQLDLSDRLANVGEVERDHLGQRHRCAPAERGNEREGSSNMSNSAAAWGVGLYM